MPLNAESLSTHSRQEFCLALKAARERKGITLAEVSATTKIPASLFAALERNDLRCWPKGLFRRSFFRDYVRAIGVPVAEVCAEFVRLFPDEAGSEPTKVAGVAEVANQAADVRLMLDAAWHGRRASVLSRLLAVPIDAGAVILMALALAGVTGLDRPAATAIVALAYYSLATALVGESPAKWAMSSCRSSVDASMHGRAAVLASWRRVADAISQVFGSADAGAAEPVEEPERRTWITDARRVGPAPPGRLRVRFKISQ